MLIAHPNRFQKYYHAKSTSSIKGEFSISKFLQSDSKQGFITHLAERSAAFLVQGEKISNGELVFAKQLKALANLTLAEYFVSQIKALIETRNNIVHNMSTESITENDIQVLNEQVALLQPTQTTLDWIEKWALDSDRYEVEFHYEDGGGAIGSSFDIIWGFLNVLHIVSMKDEIPFNDFIERNYVLSFVR